RAGRSICASCRSFRSERPLAERLVVLLLRPLETLGVERLDRVGGARDNRLGVLGRLEVRQDVIREWTRVAAARSADADAQAEEVRRPELLCDRTQAVVPREAAAEPRLQAS